jgi:hypothetical protein
MVLKLAACYATENSAYKTAHVFIWYVAGTQYAIKCLPSESYSVENKHRNNIMSRDRVTIDRVWISNWIYWKITTRYYTSQITIGNTRSSQSVTDFTSLCLVTACNDGRPLPLGSRTVPGLSYQLLKTTAHKD